MKWYGKTGTQICNYKMFTSEEKIRYSRHFVMPEVGEEGQKKLKAAKVLVIGAGGLGCPMLQYLCAAGVGTIGIVDGDKVSESNLQRQILYTPNDVGKNKAKIAAIKLQEQNPCITINSYEHYIDTSNAIELISKYDIIADGTDTFETRYLINDACIIANKPFVAASVLQWEGQLSVYNYLGGPTYRCLYPEPPSAADSPTCAQAGVIGVLPGIIGCLQANEIIKMILQKKDILSGRLLRLDALTMEMNIFKIYLNTENKNIHSLIPSNYNCGMKVEELTAQQFKNIDKSSIQLLDVRERHEYAEQNIGGLNIPLPELENNIQLLDRDKPIIVHCASGKRSKIAVEILIKNNFREVLNLNASLFDLLD